MRFFSRLYFHFWVKSNFKLKLKRWKNVKTIFHAIIIIIEINFEWWSSNFIPKLESQAGIILNILHVKCFREKCISKLNGYCFPDEMTSIRNSVYRIWSNLLDITLYRVTQTWKCLQCMMQCFMSLLVKVDPWPNWPVVFACFVYVVCTTFKFHISHFTFYIQYIRENESGFSFEFICVKIAAKR